MHYTYAQVQLFLDCLLQLGDNRFLVLLALQRYHSCLESWHQQREAEWGFALLNNTQKSATEPCQAIQMTISSGIMTYLDEVGDSLIVQLRRCALVVHHDY